MSGEEQLILGLDQASSTGYAWCDGAGKIANYGTARFTGEAADKLNQLYAWLEEQILLHHPTCIVHEKPHFRGYNSTVLCVGCVAVIMMLAQKYNIPLLAVSTQTLKKYATGSAKAEKEDMTRAAEQIVGKAMNTKKDNDAADAIHIARWGAEQLQ